MSTVETAIANFVTKQISFMDAQEAKGIKTLRLWNKLLSKPKLDEDGKQVMDENGKPEREIICDHNGEVIDDSSYILITSETLAQSFAKLAKSLSDKKQYCSIELLDPSQVALKDSELEILALKNELKYMRFNFIKTAYNESTKNWEIFTVRHKESKQLSFKTAYRRAEVPVESDDEIDI